MTIVRNRAIWLTSVLCASALWSAEPRTVLEGDLEILYLDSLADPQRWEQAECTATAAGEPLAGGRPTLLLTIPVDHHGGEEKYPIGWPRVYANLRQGAETNWTAYDHFQFAIYTTMSRADVPGQPLSFQVLCPDRASGTNRNLAELKLETWVPFSIATADIASLDRIARLGFNIAESNYQHGDHLDFRIGGFRLVRSATCSLDRLVTRAPAVFSDRATLPVELVVVGPPERVSRGIPFTIRQGDRVLREETLPVRRGQQVLEMDIAELRLGPGAYELVAFAADPARRRSAGFTVVTSPWQVD